MFPMFVHEPAEKMFLLSMKLTRFSLMRFKFSLWELEQGSKIWIRMRGNSFNVFTGHLGEFGRQKLSL